MIDEGVKQTGLIPLVIARVLLPIAADQDFNDPVSVIGRFEADAEDACAGPTPMDVHRAPVLVDEPLVLDLAGDEATRDGGVLL